MSSIASIFSTASAGLSASSARLANTATKIANFGSSDASTSSQGDNDLVGNVVSLISEKNTYKANALVVKTADQMLGTLLDVLDTKRS